MIEYKVPAEHGLAELVEKRSRFIGQVWCVESEEEAREKIAETKSKYHDARHSCWSYIIKDGGIMRYSDDGEPQGTAGQPILEVFRREEIENVCCVVTRYFGGILLGAGGLVRAYSSTAKLALDAAGISVMRMWKRLEIPCTYSLFERIKNEIAAFGGIIENVDYGEGVHIKALASEQNADELIMRIYDMTSGDIMAAVSGEEFMGVKQE